MSDKSPLLSVVVPCYNESAGIEPFITSLLGTLPTVSPFYEIICVDDGSRDDSLAKLQQLATRHAELKVVALTRNFGKELALTAGLQTAQGDVVLMIDADGQHPVESIPAFMEAWRAGARVVTGVRQSNQKEGMIKRNGSRLFYRLLAKLTGLPVVPGATDFRLIDRVVQREFLDLTEHNRITRGLVDWLGFQQVYIPFHAQARQAGEAGYSFSKLMHLALNGFVSLSLKPLYFSFYVGLVVLPFSILLGMFSVIEMLIGDPMSLDITGTAYLVIFTLFLIGILLVSQGVMALYLSHIHTETQNRPLFIVDRQASRGIR